MAEVLGAEPQLVRERPYLNKGAREAKSPKDFVGNAALFLCLWWGVHRGYVNTDLQTDKPDQVSYLSPQPIVSQIETSGGCT